MSTQAALFHRTRYEYDRRVSLHPQIVRLRPAPHTRTKIVSYSMRVTPAEHFINWQQDAFGNYMARLVFPEKTTEFEVVIDLVADLVAINPFDFFLEEGAYHAPFSYEAALRAELDPYLQRIDGGKHFKALCQWAKRLFQSGRDGATGEPLRTIDFLVQLNQKIQSDIAYTVRMEPGVQTPEDTLKLARGSCRDSGWLLTAVLRELGLAARFVSGYLIQLKPDQASAQEAAALPADFTDLHAWCEVYAPGAGWIGLDPTSGLFAGEGHIPLAATPQPSSAAPISGGVEPCEATLHFDMRVTRLLETPRVTKPLQDEQWTALNAAGEAVEALLQKQDVRLTLGGEPTFVASADRDAPEWNIEAVGPTKRIYADHLIRRLQARFGPNGFLHHGQGKWYPGEPLPRWAFSLYWRADGAPAWSNPQLAAREDGPRDAGPEQARIFAHGLAEALGVGADFVVEAYEDPAEFMLRERKLAPNVDPLNNKLDDPEERDRLARVFDRGFATPAAFVLPIQAAQSAAVASADMKALARKRRFRWRSEAWRTRRQRLFLIPGDSPSGFRLPLQALTHLPPGAEPQIVPLDPFAPRGPLPMPPSAPQWQDRGGAGPDNGREPDHSREDEGPDIPLVPTEEGGGGTFQTAQPGTVFVNQPSVRTAVSVEPRDGVLCVFMPPVTSVDEYMDIVHAVEQTAAALAMTVQLEGYPPPPDPRLNLVKVTPDPGVIEVNIHPAHDWAEQVDITRALYEEAQACGLEASKFQVDGRPTGSGGGAHVVVGGATPADSPFLRRPDLLGSLIRFWQNHPSLSYLFSGLFIGPTSQAPRIDEARQSSLYEMEIALRQIPDPSFATGSDAPAWLVDRIFRNLLVDVSGNTHRAEICIDKLYNPDSATGRLGLVEFRAFEMPPHAEMNLAQQLIVRGLIAWFWAQPYGRPLIRFGNGLHDRFMLPHYVEADFHAALAELSQGLGVTFDPAWYASHKEFRFPRYGAVHYGGISLELRAGLEPWPVLGEEGFQNATARFVDSSVERLQVTVTGDLQDRYEIACNGYRVPLQATERNDVHVAGVRFRTWLPAFCLHPTVWPHTPLVFDIVDRWNGRSVGGCIYHAVHPGGRNFEFRPVNALEAEGRRRARFDAMGHTPGPLTPREPLLSSEFPVTLDLMRQSVG